jgi:hypothetical protein
MGIFNVKHPWEIADIVGGKNFGMPGLASTPSVFTRL